MSSDLSAEITAIATAALAVFAIVTAAFAFLAYRTQSQEVGLLLAQTEREAAERRRGQASKVFIGAGQHPSGVRSAQAVNASELPIYETRLWTGLGGSDPDVTDYLGVLLPGDKKDGQSNYPPGTGPEVMNVILSFCDAAGIRWVRTTTGILREQQAVETSDAVRNAYALYLAGASITA